MTPARWQQAEEIFHQALALPHAERRAFVDRHCAGDQTLAATVLEMIAADAETHTLGIQTAMGRAAVQMEGRGEAPERLGSYHIERELGSGGMGTVYLATRADDQYRKQVAVKLIHRGMTFPGSVERFLQERQILANLDHPYIARLLDGGTAPDGRPYLILDYVEGLPITTWCQRHQLDIPARCRLFLKACEAVAYAHQNLIVHRDLKPANILVNAEGMPKLLDFGIAKLLSDTAPEAVTRSALAMLTPEYASPEQVRGLPVSTAMDVYALGAILFELLAGRSPHRLESFSATELVRVICQEEAPHVNQVAPSHVPRDLDRIVYKALAKEPRERYASVEQLADDVRRHLEGLPVIAQGNSRGYRAMKFLRRHWIPAAALTATIVSLAAGIIITRNQAIEAQRLRAIAEQERANALRAMSEATEQRGAAQRSAADATAQKERADQRFHQVRSLIQRFLFDIDAAVQDVPGTVEARRVVAQTALEYLDSMTRERIDDPALLRELAIAYERVAELQGSPARPSLNDYPGALATYGKALRIRRQLGLTSLRDRAEMMELHAGIGAIERVSGKRRDAKQTLTTGLGFWTAPASEDRKSLLARSNLYHQRALSDEDSQRSIADYSASEGILETVLRRWPGDKAVERSMGLTQMQLGLLYCRSGKQPLGLPKLRASTERLERLAAAEPNNMAAQRALMLSLREFASALLDRAAGPYRNTQEALLMSQRQVAAAKVISEKDAGNHTAWRDYVRGVAALGRAHAARDEWEPTLRTFGQALRMVEEFNATHPQDFGMKEDEAYYLAEMATASYHLKDYPASRSANTRALAIYERMSATGSGSRFTRFNIALLVRRAGEIAREEGNLPEARRQLEKALAILTELSNQDPGLTAYSYQRKIAAELLEKLPKGP